MLRPALILSVGALLCSAALLPQNQGTKPDAPSAKNTPFAIGDKVDPAIALKDVTGKAWTLGDFQKTEEREGKIVVLDFWSINCPVSVAYEARMKAFHADCAKKDVVFLAIDSNHSEVDLDADDPYARIKAYVKKAEVSFPVLIDRGNVIADRFSAKTTPHLFVIDREGKLRYTGALDDDSNGEKEKAGEKVETHAADAVAALLAGKAPETSSTPPVGCTIKRVKKAEQ
jgi:thiol-disulfide isomerase/thioredoxin